MRTPSVPTPAVSPASAPTAGMPAASIAPTSLWDGSRAISAVSTRPILPAAPATIRFAMAKIPFGARRNRADGGDLLRGRRFCGSGSSRGHTLSGLGVVMFFAEAKPEALLVALFESAALVARLGH